MDPKADAATTVQPTIDYTPSTGSGPPGVEVVAGSGDHLSEETRSLLRIPHSSCRTGHVVRFGPSSCATSGSQAITAIRSCWAFTSSLWPRFIASYVALSGRRPIALPRLRALELALFAITIAFFITIHYRLVQLRVAEGDRTMLMATVKNTVLFVFAMIVLYGMFIPNTWRRAAAVVGVMIAATLLSPLVLRILHPEVFRFAAPLLTFEIVSENVLMLAIGAGVTVYATYIINSLRVEAFEARQLNQYRVKGQIGSAAWEWSIWPSTSY